MVARTAGKTAAELWAALEALPEHLKGEIIDGELYVQPRPRPRHARGIEVRRLAAGQWLVDAVLSEEPAARIPPFEAIEIPLDRLWVD